jgi:hypothetical protein
MKIRWAAALGFGILAPAVCLGSTYPGMAPLEQCQAASQADEIDLARSAAPASISGGAEVMTLGAHGYETAVKGGNGFVCLVQRSWASGFDDAEFWNPRERAPICFNPASARSVLPPYLKRTQWVLAGASKAEVIDRTRAAIAARQIAAPEVGAMAYMMSKNQYLNDAGRHWHPHLMLFLPPTAPAEWGANVAGGAVMGGGGGPEPVTVFFVPLPSWSDGTSASMGM